MARLFRVGFGRRAGPAAHLRALLLIVSVLLVIADASTLIKDRNDAIGMAKASSVNLSRSLAQQAQGAIRVADTVLLEVAERVRSGGATPAAVAHLHDSLVLQTALGDLLSDVVLLGPDGQAIAASAPADALPDLHTKPFFQFHRATPGTALFIGPPLHAGAGWMLTVSRRLEAPGGAFAGVVVAEIPAAYFQHLYDRFELGQAGVILLARGDGRLLVRHPALPSAVGADLSGGELFTRRVPQGEGHAFGYHGSIDGIERIGSFHRVEGADLVVVVAQSREQVLAAWWTEAFIHVMGLLTILLAIIAFGGRLSLQIADRARAEAGLALSNARLLQAEMVTAEAKNRLELAEELAHVGHWRMTMPDRSLTWSDEVYRIHGVDKSRFVPSFMATIAATHEEDRQAMLQAMQHALIGGEGCDVSLRIVRPDGEICHVLSRSQVEMGPDGVVEAVFGVVLDMTRQKAIETDLVRAHQEAAAANEALEIMATQDSLTRLANRRLFDTALEQEFRRAVRSHGALAMIMIDVDCFKQFNDRYGHPTGDSCLRAIADVLQPLIGRPGDLVARYGGEEFAILLPGCDAAGARAVANAIAKAVRDLNIAHADSSHGIVTISAGFDAFEPMHNHDVAGELVQRADIALYSAKREGRNMVRWYGEIQPFATGILAPGRSRASRPSLPGGLTAAP